MLFLVLFAFLLAWFVTWIYVMNGEYKNSWERIEKFIPLFIILIVVLFAIVVFDNFGNFNSLLPEKNMGDNESEIRSAYGAFGDYIGGLLNPVFGLVSIFILLWTLTATKSDLRETRKLMKDQEKEIVLARLSEAFYRQSDSINRSIDALSVRFTASSPVFSNSSYEGRALVTIMGFILHDINNAPSSSNEYSAALRDQVFMPNINAFERLAENFEASASFFKNSIEVNNAVLDDKQVEHLFAIVDANIQIRSIYNIISVILQSNEASASMGMQFSFSTNLLAARGHFSQFNHLCRPNNIISDNEALQSPISVQVWGQPGQWS